MNIPQSLLLSVRSRVTITKNNITIISKPYRDKVLQYICKRRSHPGEGINIIINVHDRVEECETRCRIGSLLFLLQSEAICLFACFNFLARYKGMS